MIEFPEWKNQFDNGADGLVIHGSTPAEFEPVLESYRRIRDGRRHPP